MDQDDKPVVEDAGDMPNNNELLKWDDTVNDGAIIGAKPVFCLA